MPDTAAAAARRQSGWGMTLKISLQFSVFSCQEQKGSKLIANSSQPTASAELQK
jgi:hypothetical protein